MICFFKIKSLKHWNKFCKILINHNCNLWYSKLNIRWSCANSPMVTMAIGTRIAMISKAIIEYSITWPHHLVIAILAAIITPGSHRLLNGKRQESQTRSVVVPWIGTTELGGHQNLHRLGEAWEGPVEATQWSEEIMGGWKGHKWQSHDCGSLRHYHHKSSTQAPEPQSSVGCCDC